MTGVRRTNQFTKDVRRMQRRGKDMRKLKAVIELLLTGDRLPSRLRDHELTGNWKGVRDLHVEPDWLLLYESSDDGIVLIPTGTHSDLF